MTTIGKFEVVETLGRGAMGVVYKGRDPSLNRHVAIKIMTAHLEMDPELRTRFFREAQAAGSLQHPNIITVFELGESDGHPFIAMEFVPGRDLDEIISDREPLTIVEKVDLIEQVSRGLSYAHERHIVHRDIKPANLRVTEMGQVKIMDFGVAHLITSDLTATGSLMGTPYYMAPEVINGQAVDARADIFSLGATFYELLSYSRPFQADSLQSVFRKILQVDPAPLKDLGIDVPPAIQTVLDHSLAKRPEDRYADTGDFLNDLMSFWETLPAPAQARAAATTALGQAASRAATAARRRARIRRAIPLVAGAAALIAGGIIVGSALLSNGTFLPFDSSDAAEPAEITAATDETRTVAENAEPQTAPAEPAGEAATPAAEEPPEAAASPPETQQTTPTPSPGPTAAERRLEAARASYRTALRSAEQARAQALAAGAADLVPAAFRRAESLLRDAEAAAKAGRYEEASQALAGATGVFGSVRTSARTWQSRLDSARASVMALRREADPTASEYEQAASMLELAREAEESGEPGVALAHLTSAAEAYRAAAAETEAATPAQPETRKSVTPAERSPAEIVDGTLDELRRAIEAEDLAALERVWIGLSSEQIRNFQASFQSMRDLEVSFEVVSVTTDDGDRIDVAVKTTYDYLNESTGRRETQNFSQSFELGQRSGRWVIVGSRG